MKLPPAYLPPHDLTGLVATNPFLCALDVSCTKLDCDGAILETEIRPNHMNGEDRLHGGFTATLLDAASGFSTRFLQADQPLCGTLTLSLNIEFVAVPTSTRLIAHGAVIGGGRSIAFTRAELRGADDALIAVASGTFKRLFPKRPTQSQEKLK